MRGWATSNAPQTFMLDGSGHRRDCRRALRCLPCPTRPRRSRPPGSSARGGDRLRRRADRVGEEGDFDMKHRFVGQRWLLAATGVALALCLLARTPRSHRRRSPGRSSSGLSAEEIRKQVDRAGDESGDRRPDGLLEQALGRTDGFIQENLDRQWKPWGTQREASVNGQGRQLQAWRWPTRWPPRRGRMAALTRGMDFLLKMRDPEFGGYYDRVGPNHEIITDSKTGFSSFALYSLVEAGRVTRRSPLPRRGDGVLPGDARQDARRPVRRLGRLPRDFMQRLPGGMFGGRTPPARQRVGRNAARARAPLRAPWLASPLVATASTCTPSRRCWRCTARRASRRSSARSRPS